MSMVEDLLSWGRRVVEEVWVSGIGDWDRKIFFVDFEWVFRRGCKDFLEERMARLGRRWDFGGLAYLGAVGVGEVALWGLAGREVSRVGWRWNCWLWVGLEGWRRFRELIVEFLFCIKLLPFRFKSVGINFSGRK